MSLLHLACLAQDLAELSSGIPASYLARPSPSIQEYETTEGSEESLAHTYPKLASHDSPQHHKAEKTLCDTCEWHGLSNPLSTGLPCEISRRRTICRSTRRTHSSVRRFLEAAYQRKSRPNRVEKQFLGESSGMTARQISTWASIRLKSSLTDSLRTRGIALCKGIALCNCEILFKIVSRGYRIQHAYDAFVCCSTESFNHLYEEQVVVV